MKFFDQASEHALATTKCYRKHFFLAGHSLVEPQLSPTKVTQRTFLLREGSNLEHDLTRFWEVETMMQPITTEQAREEHFLTHTTQQPDGRFVVRLPVKMEPNQLSTSRLTTERRLHAIERRLEKILNSRFSTTNS